MRPPPPDRHAGRVVGDPPRSSMRVAVRVPGAGTYRAARRSRPDSVDREGRVVHAQRSEDMVGEELVEGLSRGDLDHASEHVGGDGVVPLASRLEEQGKPGPRVAARLEVPPLGCPPFESGVAVHGVDGVGVVEAVGEPGRVGEKVPDAHRFDDGVGHRIERRARTEHTNVGERRDETADGVLQLEGPPFVEHHGRHRRDRFGHRSEAEQRVALDGKIPLDVTSAVGRQVGHATLTAHQDEPSR